MVQVFNRRMDRVLLVMDNVQFSGHLENALRKLGYITDALQNEYTINERIIAFNPDIVISRGTSARLSTLNVGKRLRDNAKFSGKVILVFPLENKPDQNQMNFIKADVILTEPTTAVKIATAVLNLEVTEKPGMREKLYKMIHDDPVFIEEEQVFLVQQSQPHEDDSNQLLMIRDKIKNELHNDALRLSSKIEGYNKQIDNIDMDLKKGLSKTKTKLENKSNRKDWGIPGSKEAEDLDQARKEFTIELFKKKTNDN